MLRFLFILLVSTTSVYSASNLEDMVTYLASDALEGRKPGQPGNELALSYIEQKLSEANVSGLDNNFRQDFTIFTEMQKLPNTYLKINNNLVNDFEPISFSLSGELLQKQIAFVGFGITIPKSDTKLNYDDYANIDVNNKVVILMSGDPGIGNSKSVFRDPDYINYRSLYYKLKNAIEHGAAGVIYINDPLSIADYPIEDAPYFNSSEGGGNRFSLIVGKTTNKIIDSYLNKLTTKSIQIQIAKSQKPNSFLLNHKIDLSVSLKKITGRVSNIVGIVEGVDETLKREVVVIGAHMDHLGHGGESSMDPVADGKIHHGADDNASGSALVISLAGKIKKMNPKRTFVFVLFNAEEMGLLGSTYFIDSWARYEESVGSIVSMYNFDMVGRFDKELSIMGLGSGIEWNDLFSKIKLNKNYVLKSDAILSSDHAPFLRKSIPSLFFTTGAHEDYHRSSDTADKINYNKMH